MVYKSFFLFILLLGSMLANRLEYETSPYLLQHKDNPVDWYPWGKEAFEKATKENKLIFLSIGYSTCHWCHVMAEESFEDKEVAKVLNENYIAIKVDREQYPHIDNYYQKVYRLMNNKSGGWPLTIIMTAQKEPFFSGSYIPKYPGYGSMGLLDILKEITKYDYEKLSKNGKKILNLLKRSEENPPLAQSIKQINVQKIVNQFSSIYDTKYKGFSNEPKFPKFSSITFLLQLYEMSSNKQALKMAIEPLKAMANGGIFDQIEGGFYRYSVDKQWKIPHFEKMLYTNAEALQSYYLAYKLTKDKTFLEIIDKTIMQIDKRFQENNLYKSASNADSKNYDGDMEEGFYFMFDYAETEEFLSQNNLSKKEIQDLLLYLGIEKDGTFDGDLSNPHIQNKNKPKNLDKGLSLLLQLRAKKEYPFIDAKINTAWNALYIKGKLKASKINTKYKQSALQSLDALVERMYKNNILYHQTIEGKKPNQKGILEDYSFLASALFEAYEITLDENYYTLFEKIILKSLEIFYKDGRWIESNDDFITYASIEDRGYASALGVHLQNILLYATIEGNQNLQNVVKKSMQYFAQDINTYPAYSPNATLTSMLFKMEPVIIKSTKENLQKIDDNQFLYPFVYKKVYDSKIYLACKLNTCFSYSKEKQQVINTINNLIK